MMAGSARDETLDEFYRGKVRLLQPRKGYRFALDAPLLADFIETRPGDEICELGTGNGVIAILLSIKPFRRITALELQPSLFDLAVRNVALNGMTGRIDVVQADLREFRPGRLYDLVLANPPYVRRGTGFPSPSAEKTVAKQEVTCDIYQVMSAVSDLLKPAGRASFVFPAARFDDLVAAAAGHDLHPRRLRFVRPRADDPANLFLSEFRFGRAGLPLTPAPLILYGPDGEQTPETQAICEGRTRGPAHP